MSQVLFNLFNIWIKMQHGNVIFSLLANICLKFLCDDLNSLRCSSQYCLITVIKISKYYVADDRSLSEKSLAQSWGEILHISRLWFGSDSAGPVIRTVHPEKGSDWSDGDGQSGGEVRDSWPMRSENSEGPGRLWHADSPQPLTWQLQAPPESPQAQMCSPPSALATQDQPWGWAWTGRSQRGLLVSVIDI